MCKFSLIPVNISIDVQYSKVLVLEQPFSLQHLDGTINLKTPVKEFESSSVEIDHDYENELKSVLKVHPLSCVSSPSYL
jgi:hypothetical protein